MSQPPDSLNQRIGVLTRRETEARILQPLLERLGAEFGRERVLEILRETVVDIARQQGAAMARERGADGLEEFAQTLPAWQQDGALEIEELRRDGRALHFNVTRCRSLGIPGLGALLSCNRDFALIEGFNPRAQLERTQTIMASASHCDFRYSLGEEKEAGATPGSEAFARDEGTADLA